MMGWHNMELRELNEDGSEESKKSYVLFENILILVLVMLGFFGMYSLGVRGIPVVSISYVIFTVLMLVFVLRKHLCTSCYYYDKRCHCGWGKIASLFYKKNTGSYELGGKLALLTWGIIMGFPIIVMIVIVIMEKAAFMDELVFFIPFVILVAINGILHVKDCRTCKMRYTCPGSAAKEK